MKAQTIAGTHAPHESAFMIAFGLNALLALIGTGIVLPVPNETPSRRKALTGAVSLKAGPSARDSDYATRLIAPR